MIPRAAGFVLVAPVALTLALAEAPDAFSQSPAGLISKSAATADAQTFARALAEAGHPAGFVMPMSERQIVVGADSGEKLTLDEAVAAFTASGRYRAARSNGVTVLRHARTPADIAAAIDTPYQMYAIKQTFSSAMFGTVLRTLARRRVGGTVGKEPGAGPECPVESSVMIPAGRRSMAGILNAMVARTRGVAWLVRFGSPGDNMRLQIGYICGNGVWSALSVPGW